LQLILSVHVSCCVTTIIQNLSTTIPTHQSTIGSGFYRLKMLTSRRMMEHELCTQNR